VKKIKVFLIILSYFLHQILINDLEARKVKAQAEYGEPNFSDLQNIETDLRKTKILKKEFEQKTIEAESRIKAIEKKIISSARKIQISESKLTSLEDELNHLKPKETSLSKTLRYEDLQMKSALQALQRIALRPSDSLLFQPFKPEEAIRSGLILSTVIPEITKNINKLESKLSTLYDLRTEISSKKLEVRIAKAHLIDEKGRLELIYKEQKNETKDLRKISNEANNKIILLSKEAESLRELLEIIISERKEALKGVGSPSKSIIQVRRPKTPNKKEGTITNNEFIPFPVSGKLVKRYGESIDDGSRAKGIIIKTRPNAQVVSPSEGIVVFAGQFRGYGNLMILQHENKYHTLLSGMHSLRGYVEQKVQKGTPIGTMPSSNEPRLYVELRRNSLPINPLPWLATIEKRNIDEN